MESSLSKFEVHPAVLPLSTVAGVLLALCIGIGARLETGYPPGVRPNPFAHLLNQPAPAFEVEGLEGGSVSLQPGTSSSDWLLIFTDSGCGACDATYPSLKEAVQKLPVVLVGTGNRHLLQTKLAQHGISTSVGFDSLLTVRKLYSINGLPATLWIDRKGVVRAAAMGAQSVKQMIALWEHDPKERSGAHALDQ